MRRAVAVAPRTYLRKPTEADGEEFVAGVLDSAAHLEPYVYGPADTGAFRSWLARGNRPDTEQFLICRRDDDRIAGFANLNVIVRGALDSTAIGWGLFRDHRGIGLATEGCEMALSVAFTQIGLHRVEANIQPPNQRSRRLAMRLGMRLEGFSPDYLRVGDEWRDHERWALVVDRWRARSRQG